MLINLYRKLYFKILHFSVVGNLKKVLDEGAKSIFVYERAGTPCGKVLLNLIPDVERIVGGISIAGIIRYFFYSSLQLEPKHKIFTGNPNSSFIKDAKYVIEIQHGCLDESYFKPNFISEFWARSSESLAIFKEMRPKVLSRQVSNDLELPTYKEECFPHDIAIEFYSKNPNGNITKNQLVLLEKVVLSSFNSIYMIIHPRDNIFKLMLRHNFNFKVFWQYLRGKMLKVKGKRLVISSYSSALIDKASYNDFVLNLEITGSACFVQKKIYRQIPKVNIENFHEVLSSGNLKVGRVQ